MPRKAVRYFVAILASLVLAASTFASPVPRARPSPEKKVSSSSKKTSVAKKKRPRRRTKRRSVRRRRRRAVRGQRAPTAQRFREIQQSLARSGHYNGKPTGKLDPNTVAALADFQQAQSLAKTGKLNALTLKKLELYGLPPNSRASAAPPTRADP